MNLPGKVIWKPEKFESEQESTAEQQWQWIEGFIKSLGLKEYKLETLHYLYVSAFVEGWEDGMDKERRNREFETMCLKTYQDISNE